MHLRHLDVLPPDAKGVSEALELGLQVTVSCTAGAGSSGRVDSVLNRWPTSLASPTPILLSETGSLTESEAQQLAEVVGQRTQGSSCLCLLSSEVTEAASRLARV